MGRTQPQHQDSKQHNTNNLIITFVNRRFNLPTVKTKHRDHGTFSQTSTSPLWTFFSFTTTSHPVQVYFRTYPLDPLVIQRWAMYRGLVQTGMDAGLVAQGASGLGWVVTGT